MTPLDHDSSDSSAPGGPVDPPAVNEVHLIGHLSKPLEIKEMPSGDLLGKWTLVVSRPQRIEPVNEADREGSPPQDKQAGRRRRSHDPIECISFDIDLIERLSDLPPRTRLDVHGALRRRFRRDQQAQSRYEVEAFTVALLSVPETVINAESTEPAALADPAEPLGMVTAAG